MPGKVIKLLVKEGDVVEKGRPILILEAMKMENEIKSPKSAKIEKIYVNNGDAVEQGKLLIELSDL